MASTALSDSQRRWLRVRAYLDEHRHRLGVAARVEYPDLPSVEGTPLLAPVRWLLPEPVPLDGITRTLDTDTQPSGDGRVAGLAGAVRDVLPVRPDGRRYRSYSEAVTELAAPGRFENRPTYRLLSADVAGRNGMRFGLGRYFDFLDTGAACAHEYAATVLVESTGRPLRRAIGDPCDPARRPVNLAVSALVIRCDRATGDVTFLLHRRDPATVGHAGGLYQVVPVGVFQPTGQDPQSLRADLSLWRCVVREFAEELLGEPERRGDVEQVDYRTWPTAVRLTEARDRGELRAHCLGLGVDPLTLATDLLVTVVIDAPAYDDLLGGLVTANPEGAVLPALPFTTEAVDRYARHEPTQAAGAALLRLAWRHRRHLLD